MASKIDDVFEIDLPNLYVNRCAGLMIKVETHDINKLAGHIRIPSMAKGVIPKDTILQKILYSGLPNQCRRCRYFGHFA